MVRSGLIDAKPGPNSKKAGVIRYSILMEKADGAMGDFTMGHRADGTMSAGAKPTSWDQVITFIVDLLKGLKEMHRKCVVHRDLKPMNLMYVCPKEQPRSALKKMFDKVLHAGQEQCHGTMALTLVHHHKIIK